MQRVVLPSIVVRAEAELDELAEGVELLGDELAGADDAEGALAVGGLDAGDAGDEGFERLVPGDGGEGAVLAEQGLGGAARRGEDVVFR